MRSPETNQGWEEFARNNPDLLTWKDGILTRYYRAETLASDLAKTDLCVARLACQQHVVPE